MIIKKALISKTLRFPIELFYNLIVRLAQVSPISSKFFGPPKGFYPTLYDWVQQLKTTRTNAHLHYVEIHPEQSITRSEPLTLEHEIHWQFRHQTRCSSPNTYVAEVPDGRVYSGAKDNISVISPDDKLFADISLEIETFNLKNAKNHSIFRQIKLPAVVNFDYRMALLSAGGGENTYFHWMFDVLPRIYLLRSSGIEMENIDYFLVNSLHLPFQKETLEQVGIPLSKVVETCKYPHLQAKMLVVPSLVGIPCQSLPNWACDFLRSEFLSDPANLEILPTERLYISRCKAQYRRVINEEGVINLLKKFDFKVLILEELTIPEQALRFASASMVVAPHGGGLSNVVFCQPRTQVIEFFSPNYIIPAFWSISSQVNLDYYYLIGEGSSDACEENLNKYLTRPNFYEALCQDIKVDLDTLKNTLDLALSRK
jgi:capsular polysaccharide biosynthesis protein